MKKTKMIRRKVNPMQCVEYKGVRMRRLTLDRLKRLQKLWGCINIEKMLEIGYRKRDLRDVAYEAGLSVYTIHSIMKAFGIGRRKKGPVKGKRREDERT